MDCLVKGNFQDTSWQLDYISLMGLAKKKNKEVLFFQMIMKENEWRILYKWHSYDIMRHLKKVKNSLLENLFSLYTSPHPCLPFYEDCICTYISRWKVTSLFLNWIFIKKYAFLYSVEVHLPHVLILFLTLGVSYLIIDNQDCIIFWWYNLNQRLFGSSIANKFIFGKGCFT